MGRKPYKPNVSIPERDFSRFPDYSVLNRAFASFVSIPERDFSRFPVQASRLGKYYMRFQSLKGILVDFQIALESHQEAVFCFNP